VEVAFFSQLLALGRGSSFNLNLYGTFPFLEKAFMQRLQHPLTTLKSLPESSELDAIAYFVFFYFFSFFLFTSSIEQPRQPQVRHPFSPIWILL
jgi:hypothetical protein